MTSLIVFQVSVKFVYPLSTKYLNVFTISCTVSHIQVMYINIFNNILTKKHEYDHEVDFGVTS